MWARFYSSSLFWLNAFQLRRYVLVPWRAGKEVTARAVGQLVGRHANPDDSACGVLAIQPLPIGQGDVARLHDRCDFDLRLQRCTPRSPSR